MPTSRQQAGRREAGYHSAGGSEWHDILIQDPAGRNNAVSLIIGAMTAAGYAEADRWATHLALEEAIANAVQHGHRGDPGKGVHLRHRITAEQVEVEVEDQGPGFDPEQVPDPRAPENLERPCGRGLLLMRHYMTEVHYNQRGNRVTLYKRRSI